jgi:hypothetical protein
MKTEILIESDIKNRFNEETGRNWNDNDTVRGEYIEYLEQWVIRLIEDVEAREARRIQELEQSTQPAEDEAEKKVMENHLINKTTGKLLRKEITKDEADEILLNLFIVSNRRELLIKYQNYINEMYGETGLIDHRDIDAFLLDL